MDSTKLEALLTENMKSIFGFALTRLGNVTEAEELASDIIYQIIKSAQNLKDEERFFGFLWKIAENTYKNYLRKKSRNLNTTAELDINTADDSPSALDGIIRKENTNLLRRELSLLSKQYREATVLYYAENLSCSDIASKLQISTEMVKYYLFRARKIIREGMNMERLYGEKSYRPSVFEIDFWGSLGGEDREYTEFRKRKIKGNILLAAYYTPMTAQELSIELGVALPYLEDEINILTERKYIVCNNGKYLTNIPVFTVECTNAINEKLKDHTEEAAKRFIEISDEFDSRFGDRFSNENLLRWQKLLLCLRNALILTENDLEKYYGELPKDGPYSVVNGGGGQGVVWGRNMQTLFRDDLPAGIQGIYNGCPSKDHSGSVIAMNFRQTLNAHRFEGGMTDPVVSIALGRIDALSDEEKERYSKTGYLKNDKANFAVWTKEEYDELWSILGECISVISELNQKTLQTAAAITADLSPSHIKKDAEYVGAITYRFNSAENFVNALFDTGWIKAVDDTEKPAVCVVIN